MKPSLRTPAALLAACVLSFRAFGAIMTWDRIPEEELRSTKPTVQADAGIEVLFRETSVDESDPETSVTRSHVRYKIFDERGVEELKQIDIRYFSDESRMTSIGARVIKPDGTVLDVDRKAFFTRVVVRNRYYTYKAITFSPSGLEPGVILEYKVTFQSEPNYAGYFPLQDENPTKVVRFRVKPPQIARVGLQTLYFRCPYLQPKKDSSDYFGVSLDLVPGARNEPYAPPDEQVRSWMIYYYTMKAETPEKFWPRIGGELFKDYDKATKPKPDIQKACATIIAGATTDLEKLERIDAFCRTQIRNTYADSSGYTSEQIEKLKSNKSPSDTLVNKYGTSGDLRLLYIALARAAGLDVRLARCSDRSRMAFNPNMIVGLTAPDTIVAVNMGGIWWFAQPNIPYLPFGALHWTNEGETAVVADPKAPPIVKTQISSAQQTQRMRTGTFTLGEDGTLEGDVTMELTGHLAVNKKEEFDDKTPARCEELVREEIVERIPTAEVTAITLENFTAPSGSAIIKYHVKVPGYASATGQRLFIQPSVFELGAKPIFTADERKYPIFFPYQSTEVDHVEIQLPEGFVLENAHSPKSLDPSPTLNYEAIVKYHGKSRTLTYDRKFTLGIRTVAVGQYDLLKGLFDHIQTQDAHSLGIRRDVSVDPALQAVTPAASEN